MIGEVRTDIDTIPSLISRKNLVERRRTRSLSICNRQSDRIVIEKIIATGIVESHSAKDASTTYLVEVLAAVSIVSSLEENELTIVTSDSINSYEQPFTFTICHHSDDSFVLFDVAF